MSLASECVVGIGGRVLLHPGRYGGWILPDSPGVGVWWEGAFRRTYSMCFLRIFNAWPI